MMLRLLQPLLPFALRALLLAAMEATTMDGVRERAMQSHQRAEIVIGQQQF